MATAVGKIKLTVEDIITNGKQISFQTPCGSANTTGLIINDTEYDIVNAIGDSVIGVYGIWARDAMVSVVLNTDTKKAYIQTTYDNSPCVVGFGVNKYSVDGVIHTSKNIFPGYIIRPNIFDINYNSNPSKFARYCEFIDEEPLHMYTKHAVAISGRLLILLVFTPTDIATIDDISNTTIGVKISRGIDGNSNYHTYYAPGVNPTEYDGKVMVLFNIDFDNIMMFSSDVYNQLRISIECDDMDIEDRLYDDEASSLSLMVGSEIIMQVL